MNQIVNRFVAMRHASLEELRGAASPTLDAAVEYVRTLAGDREIMFATICSNDNPRLTAALMAQKLGSAYGAIHDWEYCSPQTLAELVIIACREGRFLVLISHEPFIDRLVTTAGHEVEILPDGPYAKPYPIDAIMTSNFLRGATFELRAVK